MFHLPMLCISAEDAGVNMLFYSEETKKFAWFSVFKNILANFKNSFNFMPIVYRGKTDWPTIHSPVIAALYL